jgi:hypothetical protein
LLFDQGCELRLLFRDALGGEAFIRGARSCGSALGQFAEIFTDGINPLVDFS